MPPTTDTPRYHFTGTYPAFRTARDADHTADHRVGYNRGNVSGTLRASRIPPGARETNTIMAVDPDCRPQDAGCYDSGIDTSLAQNKYLYF